MMDFYSQFTLEKKRHHEIVLCGFLLHNKYVGAKNGDSFGCKEKVAFK
jgi:hypothetical protein